MKQIHSLLLPLLSAALAVTGADRPENLARTPGSRFTADCHFAAYTPDKAGDGDFTSKASRWVSRDTPEKHWLAVEFDQPREVNQVSLQFWKPTHLSVDYDIQTKSGDSWKTVRKVRNNRDVQSSSSFPTEKTEAVRVVFLKQLPDNMVRLYELGAFRQPHPVEAAFSDALDGGLLIAERKPALVLRNCDPGQTAKLPVHIRLLSGDGKKELKQLSGEYSFKETATVPLPLPDEYGPYLYEISLLQNPVPVMYLPAAAATWQSSSPFGAHYHNYADAFVNHAGIHWWRNHDVYGRWSDHADAEGKPDWSDFDKRLAFVKKNQIRECSVFLGAPRAFSTILPGEPVVGPQDWIYSYYPPADLDAWMNRYLLPVVEKVKQASPFRAHEV